METLNKFKSYFVHKRALALARDEKERVGYITLRAAIIALTAEYDRFMDNRNFDGDNLDAALEFAFDDFLVKRFAPPLSFFGRIRKAIILRAAIFLVLFARLTKWGQTKKV